MINDFLKLIVEISNNDIEIDSNIVYSNLVNFNINKEDITHYFDMWINNFEKIRNINIIKNKTYIMFNSFNFKNNDKKIKMYIPLDKEHIYKGVNEIERFLSQNNIIHSTKILNSTRNDNVIIVVEDLFSAEKIRKFVNSNQYIKDGILKQNPFMFLDECISFVYDGYLSYNVVLSEWISDYINDNKNEIVSSLGFLEYLNKKYDSLFNKGICINEFISTRNFINIPIELLNYKYVTDIIISVLKNETSLKDFSNIIENIKYDDLNNINTLVKNDNQVTGITIEQREIFDYVYIELSKKMGEESAIKLLKTFIKTLDYRIFTRNNNIRNLLIQNKVTPLVMKKIIHEEMKTALINASIETTKKYDAIQLGRALFGIKKNDYSAFTNYNNVRNNLRLMVSKDEIDEVLSLFVENNHNIDDNYWLFIELINKKIRGE